VAVEDWEKARDGKIFAHPTLGWEAAIAGMLTLVRVRYATTAEEYESGGRHLPLQMTSVQARQLANDLRNAADRLDESMSDSVH
jgi:hypothetical protein